MFLAVPFSCRTWFGGLALLLALWPGLATADPDRVWGVPLHKGGGPSELHLRRCEADCSAQVAFRNSHLYGPAATRHFTLDLDGLQVRVTVVDGPFRSPERVIVTPPPGYTAEPSMLDVEEDATGVISLFLVPMS